MNKPLSKIIFKENKLRYTTVYTVKEYLPPQYEHAG